MTPLHLTSLPAATEQASNPCPPVAHEESPCDPGIDQHTTAAFFGTQEAIHPTPTGSDRSTTNELCEWYPTGSRHDLPFFGPGVGKGLDDPQCSTASRQSGMAYFGYPDALHPSSTRYVDSSDSDDSSSVDSFPGRKGRQRNRSVHLIPTVAAARRGDYGEDEDDDYEFSDQYSDSFSDEDEDEEDEDEDEDESDFSDFSAFSDDESDYSDESF